MLYWQCECGEKFEEKGRESPGDVSGWQDAVKHVQEHKRNKEPERILGLIDSETGEVVFEGGYRPGAVAAGVLPYGPKVKPKKEMGSPYQGRVLLRDIPIDPSVIMCFYEAQYRWPRDYPDDSPQSISKFITESVLTLFRTFSEELSMGKLIENTIQTLNEKGKDEQVNEDEQVDDGKVQNQMEHPQAIPSVNVFEPYIEIKKSKKRGRPRKKKDGDKR